MHSGTMHSTGPEISASNLRRSFLSAALLLVIGGSQFGMLILANVYLTADRSVSRLSPEAIAGVAAIGLAGLVMRYRTRTHFRAGPASAFLFLFLFVASLGELLRPDIRFGNVSTFVSVGAFFLIGSAIGHELQERWRTLPLLPMLLGIYTLWHVALALFFVQGDLGFFGELPGTPLSRLQFRDGFRATELAIFLGLQFPIQLYIYHATVNPAFRAWAAFLAALTVTLIAATVSAAALAASAMVVAIFVAARRGLSLSAGIKATAVLAVLLVVSAFTIQGLTDSVRTKITDLTVGEGTRAVIYGELLLDIAENPVWGIGKGRFVETNNFSWAGLAEYPHQNLLGIGAELGLPAMGLYAAFIIAAVIQLGKASLGRNAGFPPRLRLIAATALAVFAYQQFRGLFQDTWVIRETYLWLGVGIGAVSNVYRMPERPDRLKR